MSTLNLGIVAHVDAGKTSLTERLLYAAGVIDHLGSVDQGSTQTDTLALERQRGITIRSAVVSFRLGEVTVNLIDTPGHPDFIAEVERVLGVLDGAVLVVSAVEGVQAQTRVLMRTLRRLGIPTLVFVNKVDRAGAQVPAVLDAIAGRLDVDAVPMVMVTDAGTRAAAVRPCNSNDEYAARRLLDVLADHDEALLAGYVEDETCASYERLVTELSRQTGRAAVHPVFLGSALTGAGVGELVDGIARLLPPAPEDADGPVSGVVFKVERGGAGEKVAFVRMFSGTVRTRDRVELGGGRRGKVTAVTVFSAGRDEPSGCVRAGQIGKLWGLAAIRVGDAIGAGPAALEHLFAPPTLETVVVADRAADRGALHAALTQLAEQDPLIDVRRDERRHELSVSLYGEVQKEVIQATLAGDYGIDVSFRETSTRCIERPRGTGAAVEVIGVAPNPFLATVGLRVDPAPVDAGVSFGLEVELGSLPPAFVKAVEETVLATLQQGLHGWQVTDCGVTMTHSGYWAPSSTAGDFRGLTPLVLMAALRRAGTTVLEPIQRFRLDVPADTLAGVLPVLARQGALPFAPTVSGASYLLEGEIRAAAVHDLTSRLPGVTRGEGVVETAFDHYAPVRGAVPNRQRWDDDPLDRKAYLLRVQRRGLGG